MLKWYSSGPITPRKETETHGRNYVMTLEGKRGDRTNFKLLGADFT